MLYLILALLLIIWEFLYPARRNVIIISARKIGNIALYPLIVVTVSIVKIVCIWFITKYLWSAEVGLLAVISQFQVLYICLSFLVLDGSMYLQHRLLHSISILWSLHALHHADTEVDITTYFRHHPFELVFSIVATYMTVAIFGIAPLVLAGYFIVNNIFQLVQHSNIRLPSSLDKWLLYFIVTPSFHVKHHSLLRSDADTNYSTILTIWDRIFGTYNVGNHAPYCFGVEGFKSERYQGLDAMLVMPFLLWWKQFKERE